MLPRKPPTRFRSRIDDRLSMRTPVAFSVLSTFVLVACSAPSGLDAGTINRVDSGLDAGVPDAGRLVEDASVSTDLRVVAFTLDGTSLRDGGRKPYIADERATMAWWIDPDGGQWASTRALLLPDAGYRFRGVPTDVEVTVIFPSIPSVVTRSRLIDASLVVQGRSDALPTPVAGTSIDLDVSGLALTTTSDEIAAYSPDTPFVVRRPVTAPGLTVERLAVPISDSKLPMPSADDRLFSLHLKASGAGDVGGQWFYLSPVAAGQTQLLDVPPGQRATLPVRVSAGPMANVTFGIDAPQFRTTANLGDQAVSPYLFSLLIQSVPGARSRGYVTNGIANNAGVFDVVVGSASAYVERVRNGRFEWLDVFPRQDLVATLTYTSSGGISAGEFARLPQQVVRFVDTGGELRPTLSPPVRPLINGLPNGPACGEMVGPTPLLEWEPPMVGTVSRYTVTIVRIGPVMQFAQFPPIEPIATFVTVEPRLQVPPLTLPQSGRLTAFIRAWSGDFDHSRPNFVPVPHEATTTMLCHFSP